MTTSARAEVFARLRSASRGANPITVPQKRASLGRAPMAELPTEELCQAFLINVLKNRGTVDCARSRSEAVKAVALYLYEHFRSQRLVAGNDSRLAALPWRDAGLLPRFGSLETGESVALSYARVGIAETGAVATFTGKANPAANNLLPEHHVVLVNTEDLAPSLEHAWDKLNAQMEKTGRPRGINMIAGPSSTADIEGQLVYGAHGPRSWHVILLGEIPKTALEEARAAASV
ncbi:MAG: L-lactate dehydrogenase complex protein LldG [Halioglobus sp.]|jgi:L-lactate dehydrogenase complex protein LldG